MSEVTVPMDDKAMFDSAITDTPETPAEVVTEQAAEQPSEQARDEQGRFAKAEPEQQEQPPAQAEAKPEQEQQTDKSAQIPSWRLAEVSEARRAAEARAAELERHVYQLTGQLRQFTEKPAEEIDPFADPAKFTDQRAKQVVDPIRQEVAQTREFFSRKAAIKEHGLETVNEAFDWLNKSARSDPRAAAFVEQVKQCIDPFEEIVTAYKRDKALATVGNDPNAWFEKQLEIRKADPEFVKKHGLAQPAQTPTNIVKLPPSLNRQPGSAGNVQAAGTDDASLFAYATSN